MPTRSTNPSRIERVEFWRDLYARSSFIQAGLFASMILSQCGADMRDPRRSAFTIAVIAAYGRPFKQRGRAKLQGDRVPARHKQTHDDLLHLRDKVVAHRDLDGPSRIQVVIKENGLTLPTTSPIMTSPKAADIIALTEELVARLDEDISAFLHRYLPCPPGDGTYVLSIEENPPAWLIKVADPRVP